MQTLSTDSNDTGTWPSCPSCGQPRITSCPYCRTSGFEFEAADDGSRLRICSICDEPFRPEMFRHCTWCDHDFGQGVEVDTPREWALEQIRWLERGDWNPRTATVAVLLVAAVTALLAYFAVIAG